MGAGTLALGVARGSSGAVAATPLPAAEMDTDAEPCVPETDAVMLAVPLLTAVTIPDDDTLATALLELDQVGVPPSVLPLPSFATACACVDWPTVSAGDDSVTVTDGDPPGALTENAIEPVTPSLDAEIIAVPPATPVTTPDPETDATLGAELDQVIGRPVSTAPWPSFSTALTCMV